MSSPALYMKNLRENDDPRATKMLRDNTATGNHPTLSNEWNAKNEGKAHPRISGFAMESINPTIIDNSRIECN